LDIRSEGSLTGDVVTPRICVEDGAVLKGAVEVRSEQNEKAQSKAESTKSVEAPKASAAAAGAGTSATLSSGSKVMYNESN
jgi:cytoskeletal protein CcmA (bactofilin family)